MDGVLWKTFFTTMAVIRHDKEFITALSALAVPADVAYVSRFFREDAAAFTTGNKILGVRMGRVFALAKTFAHMSLTDVERLLDNPYYEVRMGAVSIMDFKAEARGVSDDTRKQLYDLYLNRHDRINNWDLVDRAAPRVIGRYLMERPRKPLYQLARSKNPCERRTAMVSAGYFARKGDVTGAFAIGELLVNDPNDLVQKAVGSWIRTAGDKDPAALIAFLDQHAAKMPRVMLRYAVEKLPQATRKKMMARGSS